MPPLAAKQSGAVPPILDCGLCRLETAAASATTGRTLVIIYLWTFKENPTACFPGALDLLVPPCREP